MKHLAYASLLALICFPAMALGAGPSAPDEAHDAAGRWLRLVDGQDYGAAWDQASPLLQKEIAKEEWAEALNTAAVQLGPLRKRTLAHSRLDQNPPTVPVREYSLFKFSSEYTAATLFEYVVLQQDGGEWKVVGFWLEE
jgi:hypothetical protein